MAHCPWSPASCYVKVISEHSGSWFRCSDLICLELTTHPVPSVVVKLPAAASKRQAPVTDNCYVKPVPTAPALTGAWDSKHPIQSHNDDAIRNILYNLGKYVKMFVSTQPKQLNLRDLSPISPRVLQSYVIALYFCTMYICLSDVVL